MFLALLLSLSFTLPSVLAQDLGSLSSCAVTCVSNVAQQSNCALATPQCLCPHRLDIQTCIGQTCPISDLEGSLHAIDSFCQAASPTSSTTPAQSTRTTPRPPTTSSRSIATSPTPTTNPATPTPQPTQQPAITGATNISSNPSSASATTTSTTTTTTSSSTTSSSTTTSSLANTLTLPLTILSTPSQPQTVVVLSTQFPSSPFTGNTGGASRNFISTAHLATLLLFTALCSSLLDLI